MPERPEDLDEELARIARATASIQPSEGLRRRVRGALLAERDAARRRAFFRAGRRMIVAAVALAALTLVFAAERSHEIDEDVAVSYGVEELEW